MDLKEFVCTGLQIGGDKAIQGKDPQRGRAWDQDLFSDDWYYLTPCKKGHYGPYDSKEDADEACIASRTERR